VRLERQRQAAAPDERYAKITNGAVAHKSDDPIGPFGTIAVGSH
jgi:hypothetical protein